MRNNERLFLAAVLCVAVVFAALSVSNVSKVIGTEPALEFGARGAAGIPRNVDLNRVKQLIEEGHLSGREAEFYRKADEGPTGPPSGKSENAPRVP